MGVDFEDIKWYLIWSEDVFYVSSACWLCFFSRSLLHFLNDVFFFLVIFLIK